MFDSQKKVSYYIEIQLNKGRMLSDIKDELISKGIPKELIDRSVNEVYKDEMKFIHSKYEEKKHTQKPVRSFHINKNVLASLGAGFAISVLILVIAYFLGAINI